MVPVGQIDAADVAAELAGTAGTEQIVGKRQNPALHCPTTNSDNIVAVAAAAAAAVVAAAVVVAAAAGAAATNIAAAVVVEAAVAAIAVVVAAAAAAAVDCAACAVALEHPSISLCKPQPHDRVWRTSCTNLETCTHPQNAHRCHTWHRHRCQPPDSGTVCAETVSHDHDQPGQLQNHDVVAEDPSVWSWE